MGLSVRRPASSGALARLAGLTLTVALSLAPSLHAQDRLASYSDAFEAQRDRGQPAIEYTVRVDSADRSGFSVEMRVRNAPDTLRLAMPVWAPGAYRLANFARNVRDLTVGIGARAIGISRPDSSRWRAVVPRGADVTIRYRVVYPSAEAATAANNRAFLRETGGLLDGPATFVYLEGEKLVPAHVRLDLPRSWRVATGLVPTVDPRVFFAPSYDVLIDSPIMMGALRSWRFDLRGIPHTVAYWPRPDAVPFDTAAFVRGIEQMVRAGVGIVGDVPYREYTFLFIDGTGGGLEHLNSTTIGATSAALAKNPQDRAGTTAHEYFHLWNVKRVRPVVLGPFDYQRAVRTTDLWWSEGVTDWFGDEITRRAGLTSDSAARAELSDLIASYLNNPASTRISPERSSWTAWDTPAANGGYSISYYTQGAILGAMLELVLRDATGTRAGMDDVMRLLYDRFAAARGFTGEELLNAVNGTCGCDLQSFFQSHVSGAQPIDFDRYLNLAGWRLVTTRAIATDSLGPKPDMRASVIAFAGVGSAGGAAGNRPKLSVGDPTSAWGRAGITTGDELVSIDGRPIANESDFKSATGKARVGETLRVSYVRDGVRHDARVVLTTYQTTKVRIEPLPSVSERQRAVRAAWLLGASSVER